MALGCQHQSRAGGALKRIGLLLEEVPESLQEPSPVLAAAALLSQLAEGVLVQAEGSNAEKAQSVGLPAPESCSVSGLWPQDVRVPCRHPQSPRTRCTHAAMVAPDARLEELGDPARCGWKPQMLGSGGKNKQTNKNARFLGSFLILSGPRWVPSCRRHGTHSSRGWSRGYFSPGREFKAAAGGTRAPGAAQAFCP